MTADEFMDVTANRDNDRPDQGQLARMALLPSGDARPPAVPFSGTGSSGVSAAGVYLSRLGAGSRPAMRQSLELLASLLSNGQVHARDLAWQNFGYAHAMALRSTLIDAGYKPATINRHLAAWRGVQRETFRLGLCDADHLERARDIPPVRNERGLVGRALPVSEIGALLDACDADHTHPITAVRDAAVVALLWGTAVRRAEAVAIDVHDVDAETGAITIHGKGTKSRIVFANHATLDRLQQWLSARGPEPGPLLRPVDRNQIIRNRRLSSSAIAFILDNRTHQAGLDHVSPHMLRRSSATALLGEGVDVLQVAGLLGHSGPEVTKRYDLRSHDALRQAAHRLPMPA